LCLQVPITVVIIANCHQFALAQCSSNPFLHSFPSYVVHRNQCDHDDKCDHDRNYDRNRGLYASFFAFGKKKNRRVSPVFNQFFIGLRYAFVHLYLAVKLSVNHRFLSRDKELTRVQSESAIEIDNEYSYSVF